MRIIGFLYVNLFFLLCVSRSAFGDATNLKRAIDDYRNKDYVSAAQRFYIASEDSLLHEFHERSQLFLANSLYHIGFRYGTLQFLMPILKQGPKAPFFKAALKKAFIVSEMQSDHDELGRVLVALPTDQFPLSVRDEISFRLGLRMIELKEWDKATMYFKTIKENHLLFRRAQFLLGIIHFKEKNYKKAILQFKKLIERYGFKNDKVLEDQTFLALARIFYALGKYDHSLTLYQQVPKNSKEWSAALYESTWALFMMGNYNKALGNLHTLRSPHFRHLAIPELPLLTAIIYHNLCMFDDAKLYAELYHAEFDSHEARLNQWVKLYRRDNSRFLGLIDTITNKGHGAVGVRTLLQNPQFYILKNQLEMASSEVTRFQDQPKSFRESEVGQILQRTLLKFLAVNKRKLATFAHKIWKSTLYELNGISTQADLVKFEALSEEEKRLATTGDDQLKLQLAKYNDLSNARRNRTNEFYFWSFDEEFWIDEMGDFEFAYESQCK